MKPRFLLPTPPPPPHPLFDLEPPSRVGAGRGRLVATASVGVVSGYGPWRRRGRGRLASVYIALGPCQRARRKRLPTIRAPGGGTLSPAIWAGWGGRTELRLGAGRGSKHVFGVCCRGFLGTRLSLRRLLPQGFVLTGNVPLEGRGGRRTWARGVQTPNPSP